MKTVVLLLAFLGLALADPSVYFVEKFDSGTFFCLLFGTEDGG